MSFINKNEVLLRIIMSQLAQLNVAMLATLPGPEKKRRELTSAALENIGKIQKEEEKLVGILKGFHDKRG